MEVITEAINVAMNKRKAKSAVIREAVDAGDAEEVMRLLIKGGMEPKGYSTGGESPLLHASRTGQGTVVGTLLASGADVNHASGDERNTALHVATEAGQAHIVWRLLAARADTKARNANGRTPLHCAAAGGSAKVAAGLIHAGAELAARDAAGDTPLSAAVSSGNYKVAALLLYAKADPNAIGKGKNTPLHAASTRGKIDIVVMLLRAGAHPSPRHVNTGETPLHLAAREGFADVVQALLSAGAKATVKTHAGLTPLDVAKQRGHQLVVRELLPALQAAGGRQDNVALLRQAGGQVRRNSARFDVKTPLERSPRAVRRPRSSDFGTRERGTSAPPPSGSTSSSGLDQGELDACIRASLAVAPFPARERGWDADGTRCRGGSRKRSGREGGSSPLAAAAVAAAAAAAADCSKPRDGRGRRLHAERSFSRGRRSNGTRDTILLARSFSSASDDAEAEGSGSDDASPSAHGGPGDGVEVLRNDLWLKRHGMAKAGDAGAEAQRPESNGFDGFIVRERAASDCSDFMHENEMWDKRRGLDSKKGIGGRRRSGRGDGRRWRPVWARLKGAVTVRALVGARNERSCDPGGEEAERKEKLEMLETEQTEGQTQTQTQTQP